jgi:hypothetical protein
MSPINCKKGKLTHNLKQSLFASWLKSWYQKCVHKCHHVRRHHVHKEVQIVCWRFHCHPQELKMWWPRLWHAFTLLLATMTLVRDFILNQNQKENKKPSDIDTNGCKQIHNKGV